MAAQPVFDSDFRERLHALLAWRRDVRRFRRTPLPDGAIERLLELACLAPSVGLSEPWRFVVVEEPARRAAIRRNFLDCNAAALAAAPAPRAARYARLKLAGLEEAPCHLAIFANSGTRQGHGLGRRTMPETIAYSAVAAAHTLWLAARAEGIGMGWVSILDPIAVAAALDVPAEWSLIGYFCLGYPEEEDDMPELQRADWERRRPTAQIFLRR
ncbi:MAG: 5,6-dimethylbenzimidazole synthase [Alphaproteobacteria bacterium]|nr:5,6-dimethylbenzimidazole synthase [Alphaproteobacteria bacterium]